MNFNIADLAKAWDRSLKGKKVKTAHSGSASSQSFFALSKALIKIVEKKKKWVRNE